MGVPSRFGLNGLPVNRPPQAQVGYGAGHPSVSQDFPLSEALGNRLHDNPEGPTLKLDGPATPVAHRYAKLHDLSLQAPQPDSAVTENSGPVWHAETVVHVLFGKGQVIREEERSFEVRFDNGRTLNFSKKSAHLYFQAAV